MRLIELQPQFYRYERRLKDVSVSIGDPQTWHERGRPVETRVESRDCLTPVDSLLEAQCVVFICPACGADTPADTHRIEVTFAGRGVKEGAGIRDSEGRDVRWQARGTCYDDLTLRPSIHLTSGCGWHGFVTDGKVTAA